MINTRLQTLAGKNSAIRAMFEEGNRLAALYGRENVYDFSLGNPNLPAPERVNREAIRLLNSEKSTVLHGYMPNAGFPDVRAAVADSLNRRFGTEYTGENVLMTVGAAGGLNVILQTLLNAGDEVITFAPYFLEYGNYVANFGGILRTVDTSRSNFLPDGDSLREAITERTKAVIINNPNNPTGVVYSAETVRGIADALRDAEETFGHPIYLISDEPYRELCYDGARVPWLPACYRDTIVGYSWSKSLSLPGERIGYLCIPSEIAESALIRQAAAVSNRILGYVNAPSLMQKTVASCLEEETDVAFYDANRRSLYEGLTGLGFDCLKPEGAFYLWMKTPGDEAEFVRKAKELRILLVPGSSFACPGYVRLAYCVSPDTIRNSLPAFRALAQVYQLLS